MVHKKIFRLIVFLFLTTAVQAEEYDLYDYWSYTGQTITSGWDAMPNAVEYQVELFHVEQVVPVALGRTSSTQIQFTCPRSGHYLVRVKSIGESGESGWASSDDIKYATVNEVPRGWWVYCHVAPPTETEIGE
jgi:hypothetical protein